MRNARHKLLAHPVGLLLAQQIILQHLVHFDQFFDPCFQLFGHIVDAAGDLCDLVPAVYPALLGKIHLCDLARYRTNLVERTGHSCRQQIDQHRPRQQNPDRKERRILHCQLGCGSDIIARGVDVKIKPVIQLAGKADAVVPWFLLSIRLSQFNQTVLTGLKQARPKPSLHLFIMPVLLL